MTEMLKICPKHGLTEFTYDTKTNTYHCKECRKQAVVDKRKRNKIALVEYKGGKCEVCGYDRCIDALEFHHLNPNEKEFGLGSGDTRSLEKLKQEADKCILVCSNCHREIHAEIREKESLEKEKEIEKNLKSFKESEEGKKKFNLPTNEDIPKILSLIDAGMINSEIARTMHYAVTTFKRFMEVNNIVNNNSRCKLDSYTIEQLVSDLSEYHNFSAIGRNYNVTGASIKKWCGKHGLPIKLDTLKEFLFKK